MERMIKKQEVRMDNASLMDGIRLSVAVGPAFLNREGVQYGHAIRYLDVILRRTWGAAEAKIYPCA